jgi:hypothetical protein
VAVLGGTAATDVPIRSLNNLYGAETVLNRISVQVQGSSVLSVVNGTASQAEYGIKNFALNNLPLVNDAAGSALAVALLDRYGEPEVVFNETSVLLNGLSSAQQELMASLEIGDILAVEKRFAVGTPSVVRQNVVVESIRHQIAPSRHEVLLGLGQVQLVSPFIVGGYTTTTTRTNLAQNPNYETNASFWTADGGNTITRITTDSYIGTACLKAEVTSATGSLSIFTPSGSRVPMTAGVTNTLSVYVKVPAGKDPVSVIVQMRYHTAVTGGSVISDSNSTAVLVTSAMGWTRLSVTGTSPASTGAINMRTTTDTSVLGDVLLYDSWLIETGSTLLPYFDGTYADTYTGYTLTEQAWSGTADASTSTATWGLTSSFVGSPLDDTDFAVA